MLILPIKKKWFDMIVSGDKREEYREVKPYYVSRLSKKWAANYLQKEYSADMQESFLKWVASSDGAGSRINVLFRNGYSKYSPSIRATCAVYLGTGRTEWGAEPGKEYFVLKILNVKRYQSGLRYKQLQEEKTYEN
jgi:hypothetical protein